MRSPDMCSACSGDLEDPPEGAPALAEEDASPFWAWWRELPGDVEDQSGDVVKRSPGAATRIAGSPAA